MLPTLTQPERARRGLDASGGRDRILEVDNLRVALRTDNGEVLAVDGFGLTLERGRTVCLVGESGCGKSVTARALLRLLPDNGKIIDGSARFRQRSGSLVDLVAERPNSTTMRALRGRDMAIIFQEPMTALRPSTRS